MRGKARTVRIKIVLALGLALIGVATVATLLHTPSTVASTNGVAPSQRLVSTVTNAAACQSSETVPAGTTAIRLQIAATTGPSVSVEVWQGNRIVTRGAVGPPWYGSVVTIPVHPVAQTASHAKVCFQLTNLSGQVEVYGTASAPAPAPGEPLPGRVTIAYLHPGRHSWWSQAGAVIWHMQLGRAASGKLIVIAIAALAATAIAVGAWTVTRELR